MLTSRPLPRTRNSLLPVVLLALFVTAVTIAVGPVFAKDAAPETIPPDKECLDCHQETFAGPVSHMGAKDCEACHEQDGDRHAFEAAVEEEELCTQCHELDLAGTTHMPVKQGDCTVCHQIHSAEQPKLLNAPMLELCTECHDDLAGERKAHVHGPFGGGQCQGCHAPHASKNESLLLDEGSALCQRCHEDFRDEAAAGQSWHMPVQQDCAICHNAHESDAPKMLTAAPPDLCTECHDEMAERIEKGKSVHKALLDQSSCTGCHLPHRSEFGKLLKSPSKDLCLTCHDREYEQPEGKRPMPDMAALLGKNPDHHGPIREKNCEGCHDPHAADTFRLLRKPYPETFYGPYERDSYALCFECHPDDLAKKETSTATNFRDGQRNLHFLHVNKKQKGRTCRACHEVHASTQPHHLRVTTPFGQWDLPIGYTKTEDGGSCRPGCHVEKAYSRGIDD